MPRVPTIAIRNLFKVATTAVQPAYAGDVCRLDSRHGTLTACSTSNKKSQHVARNPSTAGGARLGERSRTGPGRGTADGLIGEPTGNIVVLGAASAHDFMPLGQYPSPIASQIDERF